MGIAASVAGLAASGVSIGTGMAGAVDAGGSTSRYGGGSRVPTGYEPTAQPQMDQYSQTLMAPYATAAGALPGAVANGNQFAYHNLVDNPYASNRQTQANAAGAYGVNTLAPMEMAGASNLNNMATSAVPYASSILATGFDPQHALYDRTQQQVQDQLRATSAASGISGTPYGAGVEGQGLTNFNIDWQNQQLKRQMEATQGYGNLTGAIGKGYAGAAGLGSMGMATQEAGGSIPYASFMGLQNDITGAGNAYTGATTNAYGLTGNAMNAIAPYMHLGQYATQIGQKGQGQGFDQGQTLGTNFGAGMSGLSSGLSGLSSIFGGDSGGVSPTDPGNYYSGMDRVEPQDHDYKPRL